MSRHIQEYACSDCRTVPADTTVLVCERGGAIASFEGLPAKTHSVILRGCPRRAASLIAHSCQLTSLDCPDLEVAGGFDVEANHGLTSLANGPKSVGAFQAANCGLTSVAMTTAITEGLTVGKNPRLTSLAGLPALTLSFLYAYGCALQELACRHVKADVCDIRSVNNQLKHVLDGPRCIVMQCGADDPVLGMVGRANVLEIDNRRLVATTLFRTKLALTLLELKTAAVLSR